MMKWPNHSPIFQIILQLTSPISSLHFSTYAHINGLVRMSAAMSFVETNDGSIVPASTTSLNQYHLKSKCFILPWCSGFFETLIADWLSICRIEGPCWGYPNSFRNWRIQTITLAASTADMYSASVVESATRL